MKDVLKVSWFVGTELSRDGQRIRTSAVSLILRAARTAIAGHFGGVSEYEHYGSWINDAGRPQTELGKTFVTYSQLATEETERIAFEIATSIGARLNQECVLVAIEPARVAFV